MRLHLLSDTHMNLYRSSTWPYPLPPHDILVLAGDISEYTGRPGDLGDVFEEFRSRTESPILFLPGNHEFHWHDYQATLERLQADAERHQIELLHRRRVGVGSREFSAVAFHGCTLWTDFRLESHPFEEPLDDWATRAIGDFSEIGYDGRVFSPADCMELHRQERAWLEQSLESSDALFNVVITHFAPIKACSSLPSDDRLNTYFVADCMDLVERYSIDLWLYGHLHEPRDFSIGDTRFVNNTFFKSREGPQPDFNPDLQITTGPASLIVVS